MPCAVLKGYSFLGVELSTGVWITFGVVHRVWITCTAGVEVVKSMRTVGSPGCQYDGGVSVCVNRGNGGQDGIQDQ